MDKAVAKAKEIEELKANRKCGYCSKPIPKSRNLQAKYCSNRCNQANLSKRAGERDRAKRAKAREARAVVAVCAYVKCDNEFLKETYKKRFCSKQCREKEQERERKLQTKKNSELRPQGLKPEFLVRGTISYTGYKQRGGEDDESRIKWLCKRYGFNSKFRK